MEKINNSNTPEGKAQAKRLVDCRLKLGCTSAKDFYEKYSNGLFSYQQYQKYESGERLLGSKAAMLYSSIFNVDWEWLKNGDETPKTVPVTTIYKVGYVQAGKFNEACQLPESEWETIPYPVNDNYKSCRIFALGVRGDSMNLIFPPEKTTLICCPIEDWVDVNPDEKLEGKYIIAYRRTPDGLCEATVKKYTRIDDDTIILVAESSNPEIKPIVLHPDKNDYEIAAVVIGDMRMY